MRLTLDTLVHALLEYFPELRPAYEWETRAGEDEGAYVIFDNVVYPRIEQLLDEQGAEPSEALQRIFAFLEMLASGEDRDVTDVVGESIVERLKSDRSRLERARTMMGPSMLELARERPPRQHRKPR